MLELISPGKPKIQAGLHHTTGMSSAWPNPAWLCPCTGTHSVTPVGRNALGQHQAPSPLAATGPRSDGNSQEPRYQREV